VEIIHGTVGS